MRKGLETTMSDIKKLFPRTIHAMTLEGFLIKLTLFVFGLQLNKSINYQLELSTVKQSNTLCICEKIKFN